MQFNVKHGIAEKTCKEIFASDKKKVRKKLHDYSEIRNLIWLYLLISNCASFWKKKCFRWLPNRFSFFMFEFYLSWHQNKPFISSCVDMSQSYFFQNINLFICYEWWQSHCKMLLSYDLKQCYYTISLQSIPIYSKSHPIP